MKTAPTPINVIAVDGPAASGKGTISRRLAKELDYAYLDTGLLYRATAAVVANKGFDANNEELCAQVASNLAPEDMERDDLRTEDTGRVASVVAAHPAVRAALLDFQRHFATTPPNGKTGAVLDGRDIGTVVCPDAPAKLFVTATAKTRAERRFKELSQKDSSITFDAVLADIHARDTRDMDRSTAPLTQAADAVLLETTNMGIENAFEAALATVSKQLGLS